MTFNAFQQSLFELIYEAGERLAYFYHQDLAPLFKTDGSPVTQADKEIDAFIQQALKQLTPEIPIISEEDGILPQRIDLQAPFWLVDPLDGTKAFLKKMEEFVVNIALIQDQRPVLGLIHIPLTQETYMAFEGKGFYAKGKQISPLLPPVLPPRWVALIGASSARVPVPFEHLPIQKVQQVHSALKFCLLAAGKAQFSWRLAPCYEWDIAAGEALLEAIGGSALTYDRQKIFYGRNQDYYYTKGLILYGTKEVQCLDANACNS